MLQLDANTVGSLTVSATTSVNIASFLYDKSNDFDRCFLILAIYPRHPTIWPDRNTHEQKAKCVLRNGTVNDSATILCEGQEVQLCRAFAKFVPIKQISYQCTFCYAYNHKMYI